MQSSYEDIKASLGGKDPEEVLRMLLDFVHHLKPKKVLATSIEEENTNWERLEQDDDQK